MRWVEQLLHGGEAWVFVEAGAVVVDYQRPCKLDDPCWSEGDVGAFAVGGFAKDDDPACAESLVDGDLLLDLMEVCFGGFVVRVVFCGVEFDEDAFGFVLTALRAEPAWALWYPGQPDEQQ